MTLLLDRATHTYTDGTPQPLRSATQIINHVGLTPFASVPLSILDPARERGSAVHQAVHYYNERDLDLAAFYAANPDLAGYVASWVTLDATGRLQPVLCEHRIANDVPRYAGTLDFLGMFDGAAALLDYATGDPDDACKHLQTAAYVLAARAWAEQPGEDVLRAFLGAHPYVARYSVRLHADGALPTLTRYDDPRDYTRWLAIATAINIIDAERPAAQAWLADWLQAEATL
jgi:hypothetical protein